LQSPRKKVSGSAPSWKIRNVPDKTTSMTTDGIFGNSKRNRPYSFFAIAQYKSIASPNCCLSMNSPSVCAT
jgi:hypothetical protein